MSANDFNPATYLENRGQGQVEDLTPLQGKLVAWSLDGKQVLAHASTWEALWDEVDRLRLRDLEYVVGGVPVLDEVQLGGIET